MNRMIHKYIIYIKIIIIIITTCITIVIIIDKSINQFLDEIRLFVTSPRTKTDMQVVYVYTITVTITNTIT